jgi:hypothetical protein
MGERLKQHILDATPEQQKSMGFVDDWLSLDIWGNRK